jgi:hypothetical protein
MNVQVFAKEFFQNKLSQKTCTKFLRMVKYLIIRNTAVEEQT